MIRVVRNDFARGRDLHALKGHNERVVVDVIRRNRGGISRTEIAGVTGLTAQSVGNVVKRLMQRGVVMETGRTKSGGKPRTLLTLNPRGIYTVGVHLDPLQVEIVLTGVSGDPVERSVRPAPRSEDPQSVVDEVAQHVMTVLKDAGVPRSLVAGVGLAVPGPLDHLSATMIDPPLMPTWRNVPVRQLLQDRVGMPVVMEKDVIAAALGELWLRQESDPTSFVFVYLGAGTGMAFAQRGSVVRGRSGNAGEIGHMLSGRPAQACPCCRGTHVGTSLSPEEWVRCAESAGVLDVVDQGLARPVVHARAEELLNRAAGGDAAARAVLEPVAFSLAQAAGLASDLLDLDEVVLGGPYWVRLAGWMTPLVQEQIAQLTVLHSVRRVHVSSSIRAEDVGAVGAASLAMDHFLLA